MSAAQVEVGEEEIAAAENKTAVQKAEVELTEAKRRLVKAETELDAVKDVLREAQVADPVDAQRVAEAKLGVTEAKLGVAEAKLGVAKAELGVAKAELGVAEAKWQAAPDRVKDVFLASFKSAQESVEAANMAYKMALKATATLQQGAVGGGAAGVQDLSQPMCELLKEFRAAREQQLKEFRAAREQQEQNAKEFLDVLTDLPSKTAQKLQEKPSKPGSECTSRDWQAFCFAYEGSLKIPDLDDEAFIRYQNVFSSISKTFQTSSTPSKQLSISEALSELDLSQEVSNMHNLTMVVLEQCLDARPGPRHLHQDSQVGYFSEKWAKHGFGDKAAFASECEQKPADYRPCAANVSKGFYSPVLLLGAIEETGPQVKLDKIALAELASEMAGYVEAAEKVHSLRLASFPGLLIGVEKDGHTQQLVGKCVQWRKIHGGETRAVSVKLNTTRLFYAGLDWWFSQCETLLDAVAARQNLETPLLLPDSPSGHDSGSSVNVGLADGETVVEHASQSPAQGLATSSEGTMNHSTVTISEQNLARLQHAQLFKGVHSASSSVANWVSSTFSLTQSQKREILA